MKNDGKKIADEVIAMRKLAFWGLRYWIELQWLLLNKNFVNFSWKKSELTMESKKLFVTHDCANLRLRVKSCLLPMIVHIYGWG